MVTIGAQEKWTFYTYDPDGVPVEFIEDRKGAPLPWDHPVKKSWSSDAPR